MASAEKKCEINRALPIVYAVVQKAAAPGQVAKVLTPFAAESCNASIFASSLQPSAISSLTPCRVEESHSSRLSWWFLELQVLRRLSMISLPMVIAPIRILRTTR
jgi:hypothetical protein